ncbi:MAG TPA: hypothetical protein ENN23_02515 [Deltaproteobacteria bacterium]|nr:hypothetical protein [Deltaproteobacteria bacterium]
MHDLMVIGDDISSYISAVVASHYGLKTVHIARHDIEKQNIFDNFYFNIDPIPITCLGNDQIAKSLLDELGIEIDQESISSNPAYQVILPEHRIDFFKNTEDIADELKREFPNLSREIDSFYSCVLKNSNFMLSWIRKHPFIKPRGVKNYADYIKLVWLKTVFNLKNKRFKRTLFSDNSFKKIMEAQMALFCFSIKGIDSVGSYYQYAAPLRGIYFPRGGKHQLMRELLKKFTSEKGEYICNLQLLNVEKKKWIEAQLSDSAGEKTTIAAKYLIISNKSEAMKIISKRKKRINTDKWMKKLRVSHYPFSVHFIVADKCLPEKMSRLVALLSDVHKDILDDNLIIVESNPPSSEKKSVAGQKLLTATVYLPANERFWTKEKLTQTTQFTMKRLGNFLPFLEENIKQFDINKSIDISKQYKDTVNPKYIVPDSSFSFFPVQNNKTRLKNILLNGSFAFPDMGFEGEILSGLQSVYNVLDKRK